jgi:hypothetical protein
MVLNLQDVRSENKNNRPMHSCHMAAVYTMGLIPTVKTLKYVTMLVGNPKERKMNIFQHAAADCASICICGAQQPE